jgi:hypothetical protein
MHKWAMEYVGSAVNKYKDMGGFVLDVGAFNVNGSVRGIFADKTRFPSYLGVDMRPGPDVDEVMRANQLELLSESIGCLVCCEMFEHDDRVWESVKEFHRVLKPGGFSVITTVGITFKKHDYPADYWRFTGEGLQVLMEWAGFKTLNVSESPAGPYVFGVWRK